MIIGVDGCRGGWLFSIIDEADKIEIKLFRRIQDAVEIITRAKCIAIDMPIGLIEREGEEREIDLRIRKELGHPFSSSVFTVPCKKAVYADDYQTANIINREIIGKGISIQAWNICAKIKELDIFLDHHPTLKSIFKEAHPELFFKQLKGSSLINKKKTPEGKQERIELLKLQLFDIETCFHHIRKQVLKKDVADDDILDSMVLAIKAKSNLC